MFDDVDIAPCRHAVVQCQGDLDFLTGVLYVYITSFPYFSIPVQYFFYLNQYLLQSAIRPRTMAVPAGFKLEKASHEDMKEAFALMIDSYVDDEVWQLMVKDCDQKDILPWTVKTFMGRWTMPDITTFKITDENSG